MTEVIIFKKIGYNPHVSFVKFVCPHCFRGVNFIKGTIQFPKLCPWCKEVLPRVDYLMDRLRRRACWHVAHKVSGNLDTVLSQDLHAGIEATDPFSDGRGYD